MEDRIAGKLVTICSQKVGAGTERKDRTKAGVSGLLTGIEDVPTDPIRYNIPG